MGAVGYIGQKTQSFSEVSFRFPSNFTANETYWFLGRWKWVLRGASIHYGLMAGAVFPRDAEDLGPRVPMEGVPLLGADVERAEGQLGRVFRRDCGQGLRTLGRLEMVAG